VLKAYFVASSNTVIQLLVLCIPWCFKLSMPFTTKLKEIVQVIIACSTFVDWHIIIHEENQKCDGNTNE